MLVIFKEAKWFDKKVIGLGTKQVRGSVKYLDVHRNILLQNHRGHQFELRSDGIASMHKVICYLGNSRLPEACRRKKFYLSRTAGGAPLAQLDMPVAVRNTFLAARQRPTVRCNRKLAAN